MGGRKKAEVTVYFHIQVGNRGTCVTQYVDACRASAPQRVLSCDTVHLCFAFCTTVRYITGV